MHPSHEQEAMLRNVENEMDANDDCLQDKEESTSLSKELLICQGSLSSIYTRRRKERMAAAFLPLPIWILGICIIRLRRNKQINWPYWNIKKQVE